MPHDFDDAQRIAARLAAIVAIAADAIVSVDGRQRITLFNQGAESIFGYTREEVIGQPLALLLPECHRDSHVSHVNDFAASPIHARRMGERGEIIGRRRSGEEFPAEASISHLDLHGEVIFTAVLRDVSDRKRAEAMLAATNAELERRVGERTAALSAEIERREAAQAQLVRAQRMEAFGQLTGGIAHDFNNLLTVVSGNLELLEMRLKDQRDLAILARAKDAADMGARLTGRLLTFARRRRLETTTIDLNAHVSGMADILRRALHEHISLITVLAPDLWLVRVDESEIENAILNLAINARDAMPDGGRLVIETSNARIEDGVSEAGARLTAGEYVRLCVTDTGAGMTADVKARAFEPFFTTKEPGKGTGLGLSTILGFVQELGGTASLDSEIGLGTSVSLYLPRAEPTSGDPSGPSAGRPLPVSAGETVLLVEDNPAVRQVTRGRLERLGYRVIEADSGTAAIDALRGSVRIDLVFSDVVMAGGMTGFDLARWLREHAPGHKVLLTSGYSDTALRDQATPEAELPILRKPYSLDDLAQAVRRALEA